MTRAGSPCSCGWPDCCHRRPLRFSGSASTGGDSGVRRRRRVRRSGSHGGRRGPGGGGGGRADPGGPGAARHAQPGADRTPVPLLRAGRADDHRRGVRHAAAGAGGAGGGVPGAAHPRLAHPARRRHLLHRLHAGRPRRADALARQRLRRRGAGRLGRAGRARRRRPGALPVRAEGRRAGHQPDLREGPAGARRHPGRRPHRRGRHRERAQHQGRAGPADPGRRVPRRAGSDRGARRDLLPGGRVRRPQREPGRAGQGAVRQPAQRRRRQPAPEGPAGHRLPPAAPGGARHRRPHRLPADGAVRVVRRAQGVGAAHQRPLAGGGRPGRRR